MFVMIVLFLEQRDSLLTILSLPWCSMSVILRFPHLMFPHTVMCKTPIGIFDAISRLAPRSQLVPLLSITLL